MFEFFKQHELIGVLFVTVCVMVTVWHYERWRDRKALELEPFRPVGYIWQFVAYHGAGSTESPLPQSEEEALKWCAQTLGAVAWVDRQHYKIFYRARGA